MDYGKKKGKIHEQYRWERKTIASILFAKEKGDEVLSRPNENEKGILGDAKEGLFKGASAIYFPVDETVDAK